MRVTTGTPLSMEQMIELSPRGDALIDLGDYRCRYMAAAPGQEIEVTEIYDGAEGRFGLREVNKPNYQYLAFRIQ
jgi:hypothetical protein